MKFPIWHNEQSKIVTIVVIFLDLLRFSIYY